MACGKLRSTQHGFAWRCLLILTTASHRHTHLCCMLSATCVCFSVCAVLSVCRATACLCQKSTPSSRAPWLLLHPRRSCPLPQTPLGSDAAAATAVPHPCTGCAAADSKSCLLLLCCPLCSISSPKMAFVSMCVLSSQHTRRFLALPAASCVLLSFEHVAC